MATTPTARSKRSQASLCISAEIDFFAMQNPGFSFFGYTVQPFDGSPAIHKGMPALPEELASTVGHIMANWSFLEAIIDSTTINILEHSKKTVAGWRGRETKKRIQLHVSSFEEAFAGFPDLIKHHQAMLDKVWKAKLIRDLLGHARFWGVDTRSGPALQFSTDKLGRQNGKLFTRTELETITDDISIAIGEFIHLADPSEDHPPFSSECKSALQRVLGKDQNSLPIQRVLPPLPQASQA